jgi:hypothetical protein
MTWSSLHQESEAFAAEAHGALRRGDIARAQELFGQAADAEARALQTLGSDKPRTLGITAVSAAALWYKAGKLNEAAQLAHQASAKSEMPSFAIEELRGLLQAIWNEQAQQEAGVSFASGQVVVSVKGGDVVTGGAPLELILDKVQIVQNLFYRTAEFLKALPLRKKGPPSKELQERCRPWLFQSVPGSYQFAVAIQKPRQEEMFPTGEPEPELLTETFLSILRAAGEDPVEALKVVVPNDDYRQTFLKMTRNLAPTGKVFEQMEIRGAGDRRPIVLSSGSRKLISDTLREPPQKGSADTPEVESMLHGALRALDLDNDWLEVSVDGVHKRVTGVGETVDDLIGPMVNREVIVRVRPGRRNSLIFVDIEQEE